MHAKNLLVNQSRNGQAIENVRKDAPESNRVTALAFIIKAIDTIDLSTFVISS